MKKILTIFFALVASSLAADSICEFDVNKYGKNDIIPLYVNQKTKKILYPNEKGIIRIYSSDDLTLACGGSFKPLPKEPSTISLKCASNSRFQYKGKDINVNSLICTDFFEPTVKKKIKGLTADVPCLNNQGVTIDVGFDVGTVHEVLYSVCHNENLCHTHYSYYTIKPIKNQMGVDRPDFVTGGFFKGCTPKDAYTDQFNTIKGIMGNGYKADYFDETRNTGKYFAKGHLGAKVDFVLAAEQSATFFYINAAPEWQIVNGNGGNWYNVEESIRKFSIDKTLTFQVVAGTHDIMELEGSDKKFYKIFLKTPNKMQAPRIFYKAIVDQNNRGVVLLVVNAYHLSKTVVSQRPYTICTDVSGSLTWIKFYAESKGYGYACTISDFLTAIPALKERLPGSYSLLK